MSKAPKYTSVKQSNLGKAEIESDSDYEFLRQLQAIEKKNNVKKNQNYAPPVNMSNSTS